tara:strand:+ start:110 stop:547 length:438 start_codon:yes stop_codon:yes gene_type:complete
MKWVICFCASDNFGPWWLFTTHRPQFSHVFAVRYDPRADVWVKLDFASEKFECDLVKGDDATELVAALKEYCTCLEYEDKEHPIYLPKGMYCVSFIKHLLGLRLFWLVTPYQLYCELLKRGATPIFERDIEENCDGKLIQSTQTA